MGLLEDTILSYEQTRQLKDFILPLNKVDYEVKGFVLILDKKLAALQDKILELRGGDKYFNHQCGMCEKRYHETDVKMVVGFKVCPTCRSIGAGYLLSSDFEHQFELPRGTVKRDCLTSEDKVAKLQPFIECGLVMKSGTHYILHERVYHLYYGTELYKRRKGTTSVKDS